MGKKCTICGDEAKFQIKDTSDFYCEECAIENFGDLSLLLTVEEQAKRIKQMIDEKTQDQEDYEDEETNSEEHKKTLEEE